MAANQNKFEEFFYLVVKEVEIKQNKGEVEEIRCSAQDLITNVWIKALAKQEQFKLLQVIPVGSMEDGSRLFSANEFDFMMVLLMNDYSIEDLYLEKGCRSGYVKLCSARPNHRWKDCFKGKQLHSWEFRQKVISQLQKLKDIPDKSGSMQLVKRDFSVLEGNLEDVKPPDNEEDETGIYKFLLGCENVDLKENLKNLKGEHEVEAWNFDLKWKEMAVSVDTMPAICIQQDQIIALEKHLKESIFLTETSRKRAFKNDCYVVPKGCTKEDDEGCGCWLVDFAPTEVALMKSMNETHTNCQKFLKYLFRNYHGLPSYMIKSAILKHIEGCDETQSNAVCALDMLRYISESLDNANMPESFLKDLNIFGWKVADHLKTDSPSVMAILFEHHSRVVRLMLQMLERMTASNFQISTINDPDYESVEFKLVEHALPLHRHLPLMHPFIEETEPGIDDFLEGKHWSDISELRKLTKPYVKSMIPWEPFAMFESHQLEDINIYPNLKLLLPGMENN